MGDALMPRTDDDATSEPAHAVHGRAVTRDDLLAHVGHLSQVAGVRSVTLDDGHARGTRVLEFDSGAGLRFDIVVDRAFDIGQASIGGRPLAYTSPVGVQAPWFREPAGLDNWLRGFGGGLLTTGGLDHTLGPAEDDASHLQYPGKPTETYPLHGRVTGEPARLVGHGEQWHERGCTLWAEGVVRQASLFGEVLELHRRIECDVGGTRIRVADRVVNAGYTPAPHMLLYHVNLGFPLVDAGARLFVDHDTARPRDPFDMTDWQVFEPPTADFVEEVVEIRPTAGADGCVVATVANGARDLAVAETYRADGLPYLFLWRMFGRGNYVVGLEPSTNSTAGREAARAAGELCLLEPGEERRYELAFDAFSGAERVDDHLRRHADL